MHPNEYRQGEEKECVKMKGYLQKKWKRSLLVHWKRWWCVLEGQLLLCYKSRVEYLNLSPCYGSLNMALARNIQLNKNGHINIETRSQFITLRAKDTETQQEWLQALTDAMRINNRVIVSNPEYHHLHFNLIKDTEQKFGLIIENQDVEETASVNKGEIEEMETNEAENEKLEEQLTEDHLSRNKKNEIGTFRTCKTDITSMNPNRKITQDGCVRQKYNFKNIRDGNTEKVSYSCKLQEYEEPCDKTGLLDIIRESNDTVEDYILRRNDIRRKSAPLLLQNGKSLSYERLNIISNGKVQNIPMRSYSFRVSSKPPRSYSFKNSNKHQLSENGAQIRNYLPMVTDEPICVKTEKNHGFDRKHRQSYCKKMKHHLKKNESLQKRSFSFLKKFLPKRSNTSIEVESKENKMYDIREELSEKNDLSINDMEIFASLPDICQKPKEKIQNLALNDDTKDTCLKESECKVPVVEENSTQVSVQSSIGFVTPTEESAAEVVQIKICNSDDNLTDSIATDRQRTSEEGSKLQLNRISFEDGIIDESEKVQLGGNFSLNTDDLGFQLNQIFTVNSLTNEFLEHSFSDHIGLSNNVRLDSPLITVDPHNVQDDTKSPVIDKLVENNIPCFVSNANQIDNEDVIRCNDTLSQSHFRETEMYQQNVTDDKYEHSQVKIESSSWNTLHCCECQHIMDKMPVIPIKKRSRSSENGLNISSIDDVDNNNNINEIVKNKNSSSLNLDLLLLQLLVINENPLEQDSTETPISEKGADYDIPRPHPSFMEIMSRRKDSLEVMTGSSGNDRSTDIHESLRMTPDSLEVPWILHDKSTDIKFATSSYEYNSMWKDELVTDTELYHDSLNPLLLPH